jgi:hypothetical protein
MNRRVLRAVAMTGRGPTRYRVHSALLLGVALACASVGSRPANATVVASMSTTAQATAADRIFVGTVAAITSRPKTSHPQWFETVVRFTIDETVAGVLPASVELVYSGGEVGGIRQRIDGMPALTVGERYVVLLEPEQTPPLTSPFVGFNQGLYRVVGDDRATSVVRDREGRALANDAVPAGARAAAGEPTLAAFIDTLRAARKP